MNTNMTINGIQKQISSDERNQINQQLQSDLVEHLYAGCLPGTITGLGCSLAFFLMFYGYTSTTLLVSWVAIFDIMMLLLTALYVVYRHHNVRFSLRVWQIAYTIVMSGCALSWSPLMLLMPDDTTRQFLAFIVVFMVINGYATGTIGQFYLCMTTIAFIVLPVMIWCIIQGNIFHSLIAFFAFLYASFMLAANLRSTRWFKESIKLKLENALVSHQANHDILTGLPNQRVLPQLIESAIEHAKKANSSLMLISLSLNRMEVINDTLGHKVGDQIMQSATMRLREWVKNAEKTTPCTLTISRKDTFNLLLTPSPYDQVTKRIESLLLIFEKPFHFEKKNMKLTVSLGIASYPTDGQTAKDLMINSDIALLKAKQFGGHCIEYYRDEIKTHQPKMLELESDLHHAIQLQQLQVYYQPLIDLRNHRIYGAEALLRWNHPQHGFISPGQFIPLAEETGLIVPIGEWVLNEACRQAREWQHRGFTDFTIAVNIAEKQLRQPHIIETVLAILEKHSLNIKSLELEITETAILDETLTNVVKQLKNLGISLAVDDFGTGYSGLSYLKRFSIDKIKIDQSFIKDIPGNKDSIAIVSALLAMARELHIKTLAEGIETKEQLDFLASTSCDYLQGFYFSKPVEASVFYKLLLEYRRVDASLRI